MINFKEYRFEKDIIQLYMGWYLAYPLTATETWKK
jgi:transposase-like protein